MAPQLFLMNTTKTQQAKVTFGIRVHIQFKTSHQGRLAQVLLKEIIIGPPKVSFHALHMSDLEIPRNGETPLLLKPLLISEVLILAVQSLMRSFSINNSSITCLLRTKQQQGAPPPGLCCLFLHVDQSTLPQEIGVKPASPTKWQIASEKSTKWTVSEQIDEWLIYQRHDAYIRHAKVASLKVFSGQYFVGRAPSRRMP